jgi:hypothetical protein
MSSKSRIPRSAILIGVTFLVLIAASAFLRNVDETTEFEGAANIAANKSDRTTTISANGTSTASAPEATESGQTSRNLKTKASGRPSADESPEEKRRKEFWCGAKLPDELVAASLPLLQAAKAPASSPAKSNIDFSTEVPGAFGAEQEKFDYKRANELLYLWMTTEPDAASAWLSSQPDFSSYDMAFGMIADSMANAGFPDIGNQWVDLIPSPAKREDARVGMYAGMYSRGEKIPPQMAGKVANSDRID